MKLKLISAVLATVIWISLSFSALISIAEVAPTNDPMIFYLTPIEISISVLDNSPQKFTVKDISKIGILDEPSNPEVDMAKEVDDQLSGFYYYEYYYDIQTNKYEKVRMDEEYQLYLYKCCLKHNVEYELVLALMGAESGFNVNYGTSPSGLYYGPGMLRIDYVVDELSDNDIYLFSPEGAIEATCYVLSTKFKTFNGRLHRSLMAYNMGDNGMRNYMRSTSNLTSGYSRRVVSIRDGLLKWRQQNTIDI